MRSTVFDTVKVCIQLISSILAILLNSFLIYLILTKSPKKMGNYRSLMCMFGGISILFAALDLIVRPVSFQIILRFVYIGWLDSRTYIAEGVHFS